MEKKKNSATKIFLNGIIYTVNKDFAVAEALVIKNEYLVYVGTNQIAQRFVTPDAEVIDLKGKTILPGLIDAHLHFGQLSQSLVRINALFKQKKEIIEEVKYRAENAKDGEWILGSGWNNSIWENQNFPTKEELDEVSPNNPVCIVRNCCHAYWVNSKALEIAKITESTIDPYGGEIIRNADGSPAGVLIDTAGEQLMTAVPAFEGELQIDAFNKAQQHLISHGFTSVIDAGATMTEIEAMKKICSAAQMKLRLYVYALEGETAKQYYNKGIEVGLYKNHLTVRGVKLFADGSLGARSAYLHEEYADRPSHKGNQRYTDEELYEAIKEARLNGFQVSIHAIGDATTEQVLNAYAKVLDELPLEDNRYRIEHFQIVTPEHIQRLVKYKLIPSMQFVHCTTDINMIEDRLGNNKDRLTCAYRWRDIIDAGAHIANGSDAPVELVNPFHGFYAAVTRKDRNGKPQDGWYPQQCITREEALKAATIWAAESQFEDTIKGSIEPGKLADFTVVDQDYIRCDIEKVKDMNVLMTVIGGEMRL